MSVVNVVVLTLLCWCFVVRLMITVVLVVSVILVHVGLIAFAGATELCWLLVLFAASVIVVVLMCFVLWRAAGPATVKLLLALLKREEKAREAEGEASEGNL